MIYRHSPTRTRSNIKYARVRLGFDLRVPQTVIVVGCVLSGFVVSVLGILMPLVVLIMRFER